MTRKRRHTTAARRTAGSFGCSAPQCGEFFRTRAQRNAHERLCHSQPAPVVTRATSPLQSPPLSPSPIATSPSPSRRRDRLPAQSPSSPSPSPSPSPSRDVPRSPTSPALTTIARAWCQPQYTRAQLASEFFPFPTKATALASTMFLNGGYTREQSKQIAALLRAVTTDLSVDTADATPTAHAIRTAFRRFLPRLIHYEYALPTKHCTGTDPAITCVVPFSAYAALVHLHPMAAKHLQFECSDGAYGAGSSASGSTIPFFQSVFARQPKLTTATSSATAIVRATDGSAPTPVTVRVGDLIWLKRTAAPTKTVWRVERFHAAATDSSKSVERDGRSHYSTATPLHEHVPMALVVRELVKESKQEVWRYDSRVPCVSVVLSNIVSLLTPHSVGALHVRAAASAATASVETPYISALPPSNTLLSLWAETGPGETLQCWWRLCIDALDTAKHTRSICAVYVQPLTLSPEQWTDPNTVCVVAYAPGSVKRGALLSVVCKDLHTLSAGLPLVRSVDAHGSCSDELESDGEPSTSVCRHSIALLLTDQTEGFTLSGCGGTSANVPCRWCLSTRSPIGTIESNGSQQSHAHVPLLPFDSSVHCSQPLGRMTEQWTKHIALAEESDWSNAGLYGVRCTGFNVPSVKLPVAIAGAGAGSRSEFEVPAVFDALFPNFNIQSQLVPDVDHLLDFGLFKLLMTLVFESISSATAKAIEQRWAVMEKPPGLSETAGKLQTHLTTANRMDTMRRLHAPVLHLLRPFVADDKCPEVLFLALQQLFQLRHTLYDVVSAPPEQLTVRQRSRNALPLQYVQQLSQTLAQSEFCDSVNRTVTLHTLGHVCAQLVHPYGVHAMRMQSLEQTHSVARDVLNNHANYSAELTRQLMAHAIDRYGMLYMMSGGRWGERLEHTASPALLDLFRDDNNQQLLRRHLLPFPAAHSGSGDGGGSDGSSIEESDAEAPSSGRTYCLLLAALNRGGHPKWDWQPSANAFTSDRTDAKRTRLQELLPTRMSDAEITIHSRATCVGTKEVIRSNSTVWLAPHRDAEHGCAARVHLIVSVKGHGQYVFVDEKFKPTTDLKNGGTAVYLPDTETPLLEYVANCESLVPLQRVRGSVLLLHMCTSNCALTADRRSMHHRLHTKSLFVCHTRRSGFYRQSSDGHRAAVGPPPVQPLVNATANEDDS